MNYRPKFDDHGRKVTIVSPSNPSPLSNWAEAGQVATVTPGGEMPNIVNGLVIARWQDVPTDTEDWESLAARHPIDEPPFFPTAHKKHAAGVVVEESDGRVWLVSPTNRYGGYANTFPKGTCDVGMSRQATAIKEAFEESGLKVELTGYLADSDRSLSFTRYYRARRVGGNPADMGWESQAVHLVPKNRLVKFLTHHNDLPLLDVLLAATGD